MLESLCGAKVKSSGVRERCGILLNSIDSFQRALSSMSADIKFFPV
jgi:hypothetical protein